MRNGQVKDVRRLVCALAGRRTGPSGRRPTPLAGDSHASRARVEDQLQERHELVGFTFGERTSPAEKNASKGEHQNGEHNEDPLQSVELARIEMNLLQRDESHEAADHHDAREPDQHECHHERMQTCSSGDATAAGDGFDRRAKMGLERISAQVPRHKIASRTQLSFGANRFGFVAPAYRVIQPSAGACPSDAAER